MAQYTVHFSCGHTGLVNLTGKHIEREKRIKYLEEYGSCKECKLKAERQKIKEKGLLFTYLINSKYNEKLKAITVTCYFHGDSYSYKDKIKELGDYKWGYPDEVNFSCWYKIIPLEELKQEIEKAISFLDVKLVVRDVRNIDNYFLATKSVEDIEKRKEEIESIKEPEPPKFMRGKEWNGKIYGFSKKSVYLDGEKIMIDSSQEKEIEDYLRLLQNYRDRINLKKNPPTWGSLMVFTNRDIERLLEDSKYYFGLLHDKEEVDEVLSNPELLGLIDNIKESASRHGDSVSHDSCDEIIEKISELFAEKESK